MAERKGFPSREVWGNKHFGFMKVDFLTRHITKLRENFHNTVTIAIISFGKQKEIISKKQMGNRRAILSNLNALPPATISVNFNHI